MRPLVLVMLLVALFIAAMWVMSTLNLDFSQRAMAELRRSLVGQVYDVRQHTVVIEFNDLPALEAAAEELASDQRAARGRQRVGKRKRSKIGRRHAVRALRQERRFAR